MTTQQELKEKLSQFTGSTQIYNHAISEYSMNITEGAKFLADNAGAYWLLDVILSYQWNPKYYQQEFQVWTLEKKKEESFFITCTDGNGNKIGEQYIPYSDFPLDEITLWLVNNVCMFPTEY